MKIVVIGKNGQLGKALEQTCDKGITLHSFGREELDIINRSQAKSIISTIKPDIVINTAAFHVVNLCEKRPLEAFLVNCIAVKNLAQICKVIQCKFITYSTDYVFDGTKKLAYNENDRPNPLQVYGLSKLAGEYSALNEYPEKTYVIRTNGIYGGKTGSKSKEGNFILNLLKDLSKKDQIEVANDYFANPTSAKALAKATFALLAGKAQAGVYHLASEGYCSWYEFAQKIIKYTNLDKTIVPVQKAPQEKYLKRPLFSVLANTKAKKIGITLPTVEESLKEYLKELEISDKF